MVGLTAWQALFDDAELKAGQRVLINGAGGAVGGYAVQLAQQAGAHVIATASPRSSQRVASAGADEVIDHTATVVTVAEPIDVLLNLARITPEELVPLIALIRPGGVVVNTVPQIPMPARRAGGCAVLASSSAATPKSSRTWSRWSTAASYASTSPNGSHWPSCQNSTQSGRGRLAGKVVVLSDGE